jgi:glycosyltransferase involved in cell wall biosynthesis
MGDKPLVSVIIIFLNAEQFLEEAVASVFAQTYDNWELFLVDDGSWDSSSALARRYAKDCPGKVHYFEHDGHQNRGMSASRNMGIQNAMGEYIAFLDADDVWLPRKLEQQVALLEAQPEAGMVYRTQEDWYSWTRRWRSCSGWSCAGRSR